MNKILFIILICSFNSVMSQEIDTLKVYQNDSLYFSEMEFVHRRYRPFGIFKEKPKFNYSLINPKNNVYYFIYNNKNQLVKEGLYSSGYLYKEIKHYGGFYNVKYYYYKNNGKLTRIHYQKDGRNFKTENYIGKGHLRRITYIDKESDTPIKMEIYRNNKLIKTRIYTSFYVNKYYTIKENDN